MSEILLPEGPATPQSRVALEILTRTSQEARERCKAKAAEDPVWFIDYWLWILNEEQSGQEALKPFLLWPFQRELVQELSGRIAQGRSVLIEKSRKVGATWLALAVLLHHWLFKANFQALLGSRKLEYVDDRSVKSLFGKLDVYLRYLPGWMLPKGYSPKKHRLQARLFNPELGSTLLGEATNPDFGRGGRFAAILWDEAATWEYFEDAWASTAQASPCRILVSTPKGRNAFARLRFSGTIDVVTLPWHLVPGRDQEWYRAECEKLGNNPALIAQELDISYDRSVEGLVYPGWQDVPKGHYPFQEGWPLFVAIDFGIADPTALVWAQRDPRSGRVRLIDCYQNRGKPADFYIPFVTGAIPSDCPYTYTPEELAKISEHATWGTPVVFGDPAGRARSQTTGESVLDVWRKHGVHIVTKPEAQRFEVRWHETQLLLRDLEVNLPACEELNLALSAARFPERDPDTKSTAELQRPVHDWTAHFRSALEYLAVNLPKRSSFRLPQPPPRRKMRYDLVF